MTIVCTVSITLLGEQGAKTLMASLNTVNSAMSVVEDKKDLFEAFDENFIVLCTSSYCSSPLVNQKTFVEFLYKRVLEK